MYNKKINMSLASFSLSLLMATSSYAASQGPYVGTQLGYGNVNQSDSYLDGNGNDTGLAGRLFAGYQVDENLAYELGWSRFSDMTANADYHIYGFYSAKARVKTNALDLVVKGIYPMSDKVKVYGKLGAAYVMSQATIKVADIQEEITAYSNKEHKLLPTVGAGVSYDFSNSVSTDVSYNRIQSVGSSNINSTDLVSVGLIYSFG